MSAVAAEVSAAVPPLVAVVGATGTGKSTFALDLVEELGRQGHDAEIINADAMQLYRGMDIGTAKIPLSARRGIPHHLLDVWDPGTEASVAEYQSLARSAVGDVQSRGVTPVLVGGSGLYVSSVLYEFEFPGTDPGIRDRLEHRLETEGREGLVEELRARDPLAAMAIDSRNSRRLIRALEVIELTGKPFGAGLDARHHPWQGTQLVFGLHREREALVHDLDARVLGMWEHGLLHEVSGLIPLGIAQGVTASRAIGYQQALAVISGEMAPEEAIEGTQALTRRYSRRQVSWFRRDDNIVWLPEDTDGALTIAVGAIGAVVPFTRA